MYKVHNKSPSCSNRAHQRDGGFQNFFSLPFCVIFLSLQPPPFHLVTKHCMKPLLDVPLNHWESSVPEPQVMGNMFPVIGLSVFEQSEVSFRGKSGEYGGCSEVSKPLLNQELNHNEMVYCPD